MKKYHIAITGTQGFLGRYIYSYLLKNTPHTFTLAMYDKEDENDSLFASNSRIKKLYGNLDDIKYTENVLDGADIVMHLAQKSRPLSDDKEGWQFQFADSMTATFNIIEVLKQKKHHVHFIYPSSGGSVYMSKEFSTLGYKEEDACFSTTPYGIMKITTENYLYLLSKHNPNIGVSILRISNPYGVLLPVNRNQGFIGVAINRIRHKLPLEIIGNPQNIRDYIHLQDFGSAITKIIDCCTSYDVYNIGSGEGHSVNEIIDIIEDLLQRKVEVVHKNIEAANNLPSWNILNICKIKQSMNWVPRISIREGIKGMLMSGK